MCDIYQLVVQYEILKSQNAVEGKARKEWPVKWGFYLDFQKMLLEEAAERGITEAEYRRRTLVRKTKGPSEPDIWPAAPPRPVPSTSSGIVGWRAFKEQCLEKFGPLYVSPKLTLPHEPAPSTIFLG